MGMGSPDRSAGRWAPVSGSILPNPDRRPRTEFAPTEHLALEAVVAYVDSELSATATVRADRHLAVCRRCSDEVTAQVRARSLLRGGPQMTAPASLLGQLNQIPTQEIDMRRTGRFLRRGR